MIAFVTLSFSSILLPCSNPIASEKKSTTPPAALADGRIPPSPSSSSMVCVLAPAQSEEQNERSPDREVVQEESRRKTFGNPVQSLALQSYLSIVGM